MNRVHRLADLANRTSCALCGHESLDLRLRCDLGTGPCLVTAACECCGTTYVIHREEAPRLESVCPRCGHDRDTYQLSCDAASHECTELHVCSHCHVAA